MSEESPALRAADSPRVAESDVVSYQQSRISLDVYTRESLGFSSTGANVVSVRQGQGLSSSAKDGVSSRGPVISP